MQDQQSITQEQQWSRANPVWDDFTKKHPELGLNKGPGAFHNFLRSYRQPLVNADVLRLARNRFWVANVDRFCEVAFECATGRTPNPAESSKPSKQPQNISPLPQLSRFVASRQISCGSLSADEHYRLHGDLPSQAIEKLLDSHASLLNLAEAVHELVPALEWHPETISASDLARLDRVKHALRQVTHGHE